MRVGLDFDLWFDRLLSAGRAHAGERARTSPRRDRPCRCIAERLRSSISEARASVPATGMPTQAEIPTIGSIPRMPRSITGKILETLAQVDPANGPYYEANRLAFLERLEAKLRDWDTELCARAGCKPIIAYHNTWGLLGAAGSGSDFVGFIEPKPGVPPSPAHLATIIKTMRDKQRRAWSFASRTSPRGMLPSSPAKAGAAVVLLAGSVGALPAARDYLRCSIPMSPRCAAQAR